MAKACGRIKRHRPWTHLALVIGGNVALTAAAFSSDVKCDLIQHYTQADRETTGSGRSKKTVVHQRPVLGNADRSVLVFAESLKVNTDGAPASYNLGNLHGDVEKRPVTLNTVCNGADLLVPDRNGETWRGLPVKVRRVSVTDRAACLNFRDKEIPAAQRDGWVRNNRQGPWINWFAIERDGPGLPHFKPCSGADGYLVSMTEIPARSKRPDGSNWSSCSQARWIDAMTVPAVVIPRAKCPTRTPGGRCLNYAANTFRGDGVQAGDLVVVYNGKRHGLPGAITYAIVGDSGPRDQLGEATPALIKSLDARNHMPTSRSGVYGYGIPHPVLTVVFPRTRPGEPYDDPDRLKAVTEARLKEAFGGGNLTRAQARLMACARELKVPIAPSP